MSLRKLGWARQGGLLAVVCISVWVFLRFVFQPAPLLWELTLFLLLLGLICVELLRPRRRMEVLEVPQSEFLSVCNALVHNVPVVVRIRVVQEVSSHVRR
jgi:hypothetical protein